MAEKNTAVIKTEAPKRTWIQVLEENMSAFEAVLPKVGITAERVVKTYLMCMRRNPKLKGCTSTSVISTIIQACELGLDFTPALRQAFPVPFKGECTLIVGYPGIVTLMHRSGIVADIKSRIVWDKEPFDMEEGSHPILTHVPLPPSKRGTNIVGAYARVTYKDGSTATEFMWYEEILAVRDKSPGAKASDSPWNDPKVGFFEMVKKTPLRRIGKTTPMTSTNHELLKAVAMEEASEVGIRLGEMMSDEDGGENGEPPRGYEESVEAADEDKKEPETGKEAEEKKEEKQEPPKAEEKKAEPAEKKEEATRPIPPDDCPKVAVQDTLQGQKLCAHFGLASSKCDGRFTCLYVPKKR